MANWYAVYTRPRCEKKVTEGFAKRKWESYCPLTKAAQRSWPGLKTPAPALFPCYVFVRLKQEQLPEVKKVDGVINLVYWLGKPVIIRDIEIEMIQRFLSVHKEVQLERTAVDSAAMVKLIQVPVVQMQEGVVAVGAAGAGLLLPSLGWMLTATQPAYHSILNNQVAPRQDSLLKTN
jgi:transcription antitermination factor NusG